MRKNALKYIFLYFSFIFDYLKFKKLTKNKRFDMRWKDRLPCLYDKTSRTGFDSHYIYHTAWAARILSKTKPNLHIDVSSILYFSTIVSAFIPVKFYDYRPTHVKLNNLTSEKGDLLSLPFENNSINSISCMHTVEHIGLGRYGDPIDSDGDLKAISELKRVLAIGGNLLFVVPIGQPKIIFNAHRIYSYEQILNYFSDLKLLEFALIPDNPKNGILYNPEQKIINQQKYGCGCFWFTKKI